MIAIGVFKKKVNSNLSFKTYSNLTIRKQMNLQILVGCIFLFLYEKIN